MTETTKELLARLTGFTPGPWIVVFDRPSWRWVEVDGPSIKVGAPTGATDLNLDDEMQRIADANAIAALPDLHRIATEQADEIERLRKRMADFGISPDEPTRAELIRDVVRGITRI